MHKAIIMIASIIFVFGIWGGIVMNVQGATVEIPRNKIDKIWENINMVILDDIDEEEFSEPFGSFDISENNKIIIGTNDNRILLLDENATIVRIFQFETEGLFYTQWKGNNIIIFFVRSDIVIEMSIEGELIGMTAIDSRSEGYNKFWSQIEKRNSVCSKGYVYTAKNSMGFLNNLATSYSQLERENADGEKILVYDVGEYYYIRLIVLISGVVVFFLIVLYTIIHSARMHIQTN